jgi:hypothetical protein
MDVNAVAAQGLFLFLSIGAISVFSFISIATWATSRQREREAYYKAESLRRIAEMSGDGAKQVIAMLAEQDRQSRGRRTEGMKIGGIINVAAGIGVCIFLYSLIGPNSPYLCGVIPALIGAAMLVYVYVLAPRP